MPAGSAPTEGIWIRCGARLFGSVGQSGLGRELGVDGIRAFTQARGYIRQPAPQ